MKVAALVWLGVRTDLPPRLTRKARSLRPSAGAPHPTTHFRSYRSKAHVSVPTSQQNSATGPALQAARGRELEADAAERPPRTDAGLAHRAGHVPLDRAQREDELLGDLAIRAPGRYESNDLLLARRELRAVAPPSARPRVRKRDTVRAERPTNTRGVPRRGEPLERRQRLDQKPFAGAVASRQEAASLRLRRDSRLRRTRERVPSRARVGVGASSIFQPARLLEHRPPADLERRRGERRLASFEPAGELLDELTSLCVPPERE